MDKLPNYNGSIDLISGLRPKNNGDFPLMEAHDIVVDENGTRLDEKLASIGEGGSSGGSSSVTRKVTLAELVALCTLENAGMLVNITANLSNMPNNVDDDIGNLLATYGLTSLQASIDYKEINSENAFLISSTKTYSNGGTLFGFFVRLVTLNGQIGINSYELWGGSEEKTLASGELTDEYFNFYVIEKTVTGSGSSNSSGGGLKEITLAELVEMVNADNFGVSVNVSLKDPQGQGNTLGMFSGNIFDFNTYPAFVVAHTATGYESTNGVIDNRTDTVTRIQILKVNDTTMVGGDVVKYVYTNSATLPTKEVVFSVGTIEELEQFIQAIYVYTGQALNSSGGNDLVIVDELPTENIPENTIYLLNKGYADVNVYYCYGDGYMSLAEAVASSIDATPTVYYEVVSELPSNPTATDLQAFNPIYCYIYNNVPYVYGNAGSGDMWLTVSALFAQMGAPIEDKGWTSNIASETEEGLFVTYNGRYISYTRKNGAWITICDNNVNAEEEIELIGEHSEQDNTYLDHVIKLNEETKQAILEKLAKNPKGFIIYYPFVITGVDNAESVIVIENASVFKANNSIINMGGNGVFSTLVNNIPCCVSIYVDSDNSYEFRISDIQRDIVLKPTLTDIIPRIKFIY